MTQANACNLVCLPYAGGAAAVFRRWQRTLGDRITVHPIDYPGRASRSGEPVVTDSAVIVADVADRVRDLDPARTVVFGHSMGGRVAFEVVRALEAYGDAPAGLIVSAVPAPGHLADREPHGELTDERLRAKCLEWGGTPVELLDDPGFAGPLYAHLRADLATLDTFESDPDAVVSAPTTALAGRSDSAAPSREVAGWSRNASDWHGVHVVPGGHFFTSTAEPVVLSIVRRHCEIAGVPALGRDG